MTSPGKPDRETVQIDSKTYYLAKDANGPIYGTVALGRDLKWSRDFQQPSFGMGETTQQTPGGEYFTENIDTTGRGLRLGPKVTTIAMAAGDIPANETGVFFETRNTSGDRRLYFYCAIDADTIRLTKFDPVADTRITGSSQPLDVTVTSSSNLDAGRPAEFEGFWYTCFGCFDQASTHALKQLTSCVATTGADTWTNIDTMTSAVDLLLVITSVDGVTRLLRHTEERYIQLCESNASGDGPLDAANWAPSPGHRVGNTMSALGGTNAGGIVYIAKQDGLFTFDITGNSWAVIPLQSPISDSNTVAQNPRNMMGTFAFGDIVFYPSIYGLYRVIGLSRVRMAGPESIKGYYAVPNISPPIKLSHYGGTFAGEWLYFIYTDDTNDNYAQILACQLGPHPSGHPLIIHTLVKRANEIRSLHVDEAYKLWWSEPGQDRIAYIQLGSDGSPNGGVRGAASTATYEWYGPEIDFGEPEVTKQFRYAFIEQEAGASEVSWQLKAYRDSGSVESVGSPFTTTQANNINWTVGTTDTGRRLRLRLTATGTGDHDATDPKILRIVVYARTADVMRVVLTPQNVRNKRSRFDTAKIIRKLKNAGPVTIREPFTNETHTAYITAVNEVAEGIEVVYERWQINA